MRISDFLIRLIVCKDIFKNIRDNLYSKQKGREKYA
mgnify:CR=1 FL=1